RQHTSRAVGMRLLPASNRSESIGASAARISANLRSSIQRRSRASPLPNNGFLVIAHDRRGHGRSPQSSTGNDMDSYADDLASLLAALESRGVTMAGTRPAAAKSPAITGVIEPGASRRRC